MKIHFIAFAAFLLAFSSSEAQRLFHGSITFKGRAEGLHFIGRYFDINQSGKEYTISGGEGRSKKFAIEFDNSSITDLVFSEAGTAIAVTKSAAEWKDARMALVTIDPAGNEKVFNYRSHKMTDRFGWIVELGAVSGNGELVLAKCALMRPGEGGVSFVEHDWVVLRISQGSIQVVDTVNVFEKWRSYASKNTGL